MSSYKTRVFQLVTLIEHNNSHFLLCEGVQESADLRTKDAAIQCSLPHTHTEPITKDASVQCGRQPLLTSGPIYEHCHETLYL